MISSMLTLHCTAKNGTSITAKYQVFCAFGKDGSDLVRYDFKANLYSLAISADGSFAICQTCAGYNDAGLLALFDLSNPKLLWKMPNPKLRWANQYHIDPEKRTISLMLPRLGTYDWSFDGVFVDEERWLSDWHAQGTDNGRPVSWRSKLLTYPPALTQEARSALTAALPGRAVENQPKAVIDQLVSARLCLKDGRLTDAGFVTAIERLPLKQQCEILGIPLLKKEVAERGRVETATLKHFISKGLKGGQWRDLPVKFTTFVACFSALLHREISLQGKKAKDRPPRGFGGWSTSVFAMEAELVRAIEDTDLAKMIETLPALKGKRKLKSLMGQNKVRAFDDDLADYGLIGLEFIGLSSDIEDVQVLEATLNSIGKEGLIRYLKAFLSDSCIGSGWPDITIIEDGKLKLIEIKDERTGDRMHASQIITLPSAAAIGLDVSVLNVSRSQVPQAD